MESSRSRVEEENHLYPLGELTDYEVADDDPDVRGWPVISGDGKKIGHVKELIVDPSEMRVRYLDVRVNENFEGLKEDKRLLIPIGTASLDEKEDNVHVKILETVTILKYPKYLGSDITREFEQSIRRSLSPDNASENLHSDEFYEHDHFNEERFFGSRKKRFSRLNELNVYDIIGTNPDVRGWDVMSSDGKKVGKVHEMLVDVDDKKIRYLDMLLTGQTSREYEHILIPIGIARLNEKGNIVVADLEEELIKNWPVYNGGAITRDYEYQVFNAVDGGSGTFDDDLYNHAHYDYRHFYGPSRGRG